MELLTGKRPSKLFGLLSAHGRVAIRTGRCSRRVRSLPHEPLSAQIRDCIREGAEQDRREQRRRKKRLRKALREMRRGPDWGRICLSPGESAVWLGETIRFDWDYWGRGFYYLVGANGERWWCGRWASMAVQRGAIEAEIRRRAQGRYW